MKKGFTLLEILLVIAAIGILAAIVIVAINPNRQLAQVRDTTRQNDINSIQKALEQYLIDNGSYPTGVDSTYAEICATGANGVGEGSVNTGCVDLRPLVPTYLASLPVDPSGSTETGYFSWVNPTNNKVSLVNPQSEQSDWISINYGLDTYVESGLVLNYDAANLSSYPGSGTTINDLSSSLNQGTLTNGASYSSDNGGEFSIGGAVQYIDGGNDSSLDIPGDITVDCWFRIDVEPIDWVRVCGKGDITNRTYGLWYSIVDGRMLFQRYGNPTNVDLTHNLSVEVGQWYNLVGVSDGNDHEFFVNGVSIDSENTVTTILSTTNTFKVGYGDVHRYHNGVVSNVKVYNRGLNALELEQNFNSVRGRYGL